MASMEQTFEELFAGVKNLPGSWNPRRPQPEWDRDFHGRADITSHFGAKSDKAKEWMAFALTFSAALIDGYEGLDNVIQTGRAALKQHGPKGKSQFKD